MSQHDDTLMQRALQLAAKYAGRTSPNPMVGCVIVDKGGAVIAEGAHKGPGHAHAEIAALAKLGGRAPGATIYVNMEPCTHQRPGKLPCAAAVKASGAACVVVGSKDTFPGHGGGIAALRRAGISVRRALVEECDRFNRGFLVWAATDRPAFTLKAALTLDGKIATVAGSSKWITGEAARADVHRMRNAHDAILVGVGTVLADDPRLDCRIRGGRDPIRIVLDGQLRTPPAARLLPGKRGPRTIIVAGSRADKAKQAALEKAGAEVWRIKLRANGQVPIYELSKDLGLQKILSVLVEGGGQVHASFLTDRHAHDVVLYVAPKVVGGPAPSWVGGKGVGTMAAATALRPLGPPVYFGDDLRLRFVPW
ncbi:MAG TPA: bifunctional diaminohydroxyphosphoribosylaminopyrimidine deaminase/5-amino-6-(5-phosphoribosylamino)uracil reductase RibD [Kofleriaceae bacterium]|nr:bifunctional diaminohydroxyphosphoribosylaminopyrimidine deaminase/5-amino-6-(5-phosphoribosylamino)uracil reductase RibD [Kofleriaceae bacterium]